MKYSFCYLIATIIVVIIILVVLYVFIGTVNITITQAYIPITTTSCPITNIQLSGSPSYPVADCITTAQDFSIQVSFPIYIIALMSFISWFLFVLFGGIGLFALPLDLIYDFCTRPKKMSPAKMDIQRRRILEDSQQLRVLANDTHAMEERGALKRSSITYI